MQSFDYSQIVSSDRDILIDNLENVLEELNLSGVIYNKHFKIGYNMVLSLLAGSGYRTLNRLQKKKYNLGEAYSAYGELLDMNEMFRVSKDNASKYGLDYNREFDEIIQHLNASTYQQQFFSRLKVLGNYLDKPLTSWNDKGTIEEGFTYTNNIKLIKYDFVRYH